MIQTIRAAFTRHPDDVGETYIEHFRTASSYSARLFGAAFAALAHAFLPFLFEKTASTAIRAMHAEMVARSKGAASGEASRPDAAAVQS